MKINAILLLAAVICYAEAQKCTIEGLGDVIKKCLGDTKAGEIDFLDLLALKPARSDKAKCFRSCIVKDCEYLSDSGKFSAAFAKDSGLILGSGDAEKSKKIEVATASCVDSTKQQSDLCEYTESVFACVVNTCKDCEIVVPKVNL